MRLWEIVALVALVGLVFWLGLQVGLDACSAFKAEQALKASWPFAGQPVPFVNVSIEGFWNASGAVR